MDNTLIQALQNKLGQPLKPMFIRAIWAGNFISVGCILYTITTSFTGDAKLLRLLGSMIFSFGLCLVIYFKSQLFTGNHLMFLNYFQKQTSFRPILKNWGVVYLGNFIGSIAMITIFYFFFSGVDSIQNRFAAIAKLKTEYSFFMAFGKAILCNILVCLAVFLGVTGKTITKKIIGIVIPITLFVFFGFEHSIANMFFIPIGLTFSNVDFAQGSTLFLGNIIPVSLGNIVGGLILSVVYFKLKKTN